MNEMSKLKFHSMKIINSLSMPRKNSIHETMEIKGARVKKDVVSLSVSKDINLDDIPEYLLLAWFGCFYRKIVGETGDYEG